MNKQIDIRCPTCGTLIFRTTFDSSAFVEYYCKKCHKTRTVRFTVSKLNTDIQTIERSDQDDEVYTEGTCTEIRK